MALTDSSNYFLLSLDTFKFIFDYNHKYTFDSANILLSLSLLISLDHRVCQHLSKKNLIKFKADHKLKSQQANGARLGNAVAIS